MLTDPVYLGLIRNIKKEPKNNWLRLVLADWFVDHDEPERAELIRVQCEIDELGDGYGKWLDGEDEAYPDGEVEYQCPRCRGVSSDLLCLQPECRKTNERVVALGRRQRGLLDANLARWVEADIGVRDEWTPFVGGMDGAVFGRGGYGKHNCLWVFYRRGLVYQVEAPLSMLRTLLPDMMPVWPLEYALPADGDQLASPSISDKLLKEFACAD